MKRLAGALQNHFWAFEMLVCANIEKKTFNLMHVSPKKIKISKICLFYSIQVSRYAIILLVLYSLLSSHIIKVHLSIVIVDTSAQHQHSIIQYGKACEMHFKAAYKAVSVAVLGVLASSKHFQRFLRGTTSIWKRKILHSSHTSRICIDLKSKLLKYCPIHQHVQFESFSGSINWMSNEAYGLKIWTAASITLIPRF